MSVATIRAKNQVTLPAPLLAQAGLRQGDPIEFSPLPDGGIAVHRFGRREQGLSALEMVRQWARDNPGVADVEWDVPRLNAPVTGADL
ncbi:MAG: AbrB/MazE/SpoVT family DNA-binding domain-containing protein [Micrococcales bacterium]|nr:AbrB/MazE/SpoVT family DNA-binding domain-containing protein [Micrococcales bacterium]MCL2666844.1 AbrB/MazE/SpoVT family DNA-binding domain-containing protein [Micrococcales bacterium]